MQSDKMWKLRNKKTGRYYYSDGYLSHTRGSWFPTKESAEHKLANIVRKKALPRKIRQRVKDPNNRYGWSRVEKVQNRRVSTVMSAFDWEIVEYSVSESGTEPSWGNRVVMDVVTKNIDPQDIVKIRKKLEKDNGK